MQFISSGSWCNARRDETELFTQTWVPHFTTWVWRSCAHRVTKTLLRLLRRQPECERARSDAIILLSLSPLSR